MTPILKKFSTKPRKVFLNKLVRSSISFSGLNKNEKLYFLDLLRIFFFNDLSDLELVINSDKVTKLYKKIFSYLYSGDFGDGLEISIYENPTKDCKTTIANLDINQIRENHKLLKELYSYYTKELKSIKLTSEKKISKIIVFEAPPYREHPNETSHFMFLGGTYFRAIVGEDIIRKKDKKKREQQYNHVNFNTFLNSYSSWKVTQPNIKKLLDDIKDDALERIDRIINSEIVYLDLFLIPIFMDFNIRRHWATDKEYFFENKSLIVHLLDWTIDDFKSRMNRHKEELFSDNCLIALGMPLNTSIAIFEHYTSDYYILEGKNKTDISRLNSPTAFEKMKMKGVTFPMFKSNVIGGNNLPDYELVKNAFNL